LIQSRWSVANEHWHASVHSTASVLKEASLVSLTGADRALFASDMHLGEHDPATASLFFKALEDALAGRLRTGDQFRQSSEASSGFELASEQAASPAFSHVFLLGDLFEIWVGDDDLSHPYSEALNALLARAEKADTKVLIMRGNRDFMLGMAPIGQATWLANTAAVFLPDPCVLDAFGTRIVLTHGDLLCTDDTDYQTYRKVVRNPQWQTECLTKPLSERQAIANNIRSKSAIDKGDKPAAWMDAKEDAVWAMSEAAKATVMIHGHTHRPALHTHRQGEQQLNRYVMPDWSAARGEAKPQRGYFLVVDAQGIHQMQPTPPS
jgi:UDP-2,3-diacylglucosamine hydrolase